MSTSHAVVWIDHHHAQIERLDAGAVHTSKVASHTRYTRQHGSTVRTEHEFFGHVCDQLADIGQVLVVGSTMAQADFRHYVTKHRPQQLPRIAGWETLDHLTEGQIAAYGRKFFRMHETMAAPAA